MSKTLKLRRAGLATVAGLLLSPVLANPAWLPADTVFAVGLSGLDQHADRFQPFVDEWNRLGLSDSLAALFPVEDAELDTVTAELEGFEPFDLLGSNTWLAVSISGASPIPSVVLTMRPQGETLDLVNDMLASLESDPDVMTLSEGSHDFFVMDLDEELTDGYVSGLAIGIADGELVVASTPDAMRGVLRRMAGSNEPSLASSASFSAVSHLAGGHIFSFTDLGAAARAGNALARPLAAEFGVSGLLNELVSSLETAGVIASSTSVTDQGLQSSSVQLVGDANSRVRDLLLNRDPASQDALAFITSNALTVSSGFSNPSGWWAYLNSIVASYPELGIGSLDDLLLMFVGLDLRSSFFNWVGNELTTVTTGIVSTGGIGVASENLLGESLYVLRTSSEEAAQAGLEGFFSMAAMLASSFTSLDGAATGPADSSSENVAGTVVNTIRLTDGVVISYGVTDGFVLVSTDGHSVADALRARAAGDAAPAVISRMLQQVPAGAVNFVVSDNESSLRSLASQTAEQIEMVAGLSGSSIDFAALDAATAGVEQYMNFLADRAGGSWSWTIIEGDSVVSESFAEIDW